MYTNAWAKVGNDKYYFNQDGIMVTGKQTIEDKEYYFDGNGKLE